MYCYPLLYSGSPCTSVNVYGGVEVNPHVLQAEKWRKKNIQKEDGSENEG